MTRPSDGIEALRARADGAADGALHLSERELLAYQQGELEELEEERIREHLVRCGDCRRAFFAVRAFLNPESEGEVLSQEELARGWEKLQEDLGVDRARRPAPPAGRSDVSPIVWSGWLVRQLPLAASLVAAAVLGIVVFQLNSELREVRAPRADVLVIELFPEDAAQRFPGEDEAPLQVPADAPGLVVILNGQELPERPRFDVELCDSRGRSLWQAEDLERNDFGNFSVSLEPRSLAPGEYRLVLFGMSRDGARAALGEYRLAIED